MANRAKANSFVMEDRDDVAHMVGSDVKTMCWRVPVPVHEAFVREFGDENGRYGDHLARAMREYLKSHAGYRFYVVKEMQ